MRLRQPRLSTENVVRLINWRGDMILDVHEYAIVTALLGLIAIGCAIGFIACRRWWRR
jgi:hypothetical protein